MSLIFKRSVPCLTQLSPIDAHHRFIAEECDWGFTRFSELRKLFSIQEGHARPTIEDEAAEVSVFVRVLEDPTGVLWHNFVKFVFVTPLTLSTFDPFGSQLRLQKGDWICRIEESRRDMLHELVTPITVLYTIFPQGKF